MRKLILLTGATALALTVGLSGVASANHGQVVQTTDGTVSPTFLPKSVYKHVTLRVITSVRDAADPAACASANPPNTCTTPPKASQAYVDFDKNLRFNWNSAGKCARQSIAGDTTATARATCPNAIIGSGQAIARGGITGGPVAPGFIDATVTAFNDTQPNTIILHVDIGGVGINLIGTLVNSPLGGFAKRLAVPVPNTGNALTRFDVTINRSNYVQATCPDSPINFRGLFEYAHDRGDEDPGLGITPIYPASAIGASSIGCTKNTAPFKPCKNRALRAFRRKKRKAIRNLSGPARTRAIRRAKKQRNRAVRKCKRLHL